LLLVSSRHTQDNKQ